MEIYIINGRTGEVVAELSILATKEEILNAICPLPVDYYIVNYGGICELDLWDIFKYIF